MNKKRLGGLKMSQILKKFETKKSIKRGDIWYADLPQVGDSIQHGGRPVIIISNDYCNKYSSVITAIPLTSVNKKKNQPTHIYIDPIDELKGSIVICEQIITVAKNRLTRKICHIDDKDMIRIEKGIKIQVGI